MDRHRRLQEILRELNKNQKLEVDEVVELLSISPATVRRDFNYLVEHYNVDKTWGGITLLNSNDIVDSMVPVQQRRAKNIDSKKAIAKKAASLTQDGDIIFIDGGSTTLEMVPHLVNKKLKIITNSILIAQRIDMLNPKFASDVFLTGGLLYPDSGLVVGPHAVDYIQKFNANWTFLSIGGITEIGPTNSNVLVVETEKAMIGKSERTIILADSSKIGKNDLVKICDLNEIDYLISETSINDEYLHTLTKDKMELILV